MNQQLEALKAALSELESARQSMAGVVSQTVLDQVQAAIADAEIPVMDLDQIMLDSMKKAASESAWIPHEHYYMSDWVADVCEYLRKGHPK